MPTDLTLASYLILAALGYAAWYAAACALFPFAHCRACQGGKRRSPGRGRTFRYCRRCHGTGARVRIGRRLYTYLRNEHRHGTRRDPFDA